jgi:hypothetical protein
MNAGNKSRVINDVRELVGLLCIIFRYDDIPAIHSMLEQGYEYELIDQELGLQNGESKQQYQAFKEMVESAIIAVALDEAIYAMDFTPGDIILRELKRLYKN